MPCLFVRARVAGNNREPRRTHPDVELADDAIVASDAISLAKVASPCHTEEEADGND
jgi:hypothetical protein